MAQHVVAAAWLDDALESVIRAQFRPDKSVANDVMRADGPLGSFSARIKIAYLLDLIELTARCCQLKLFGTSLG